MATVNVGITGASGVIYARRLLEYLIAQKHHINLTVTAAGLRVLQEELGFTNPPDESLEQSFRLWLGMPPDYPGLEYFPNEDIGARLASGSVKVEAMVIIPCTMHTLSSIAHGSSSNLLERAADVMLKEGRPLLLVPRETPLNRLHLENMIKVLDAGAKIVPPMPAFYNRPETIDDLVNFVVGRILDLLGMENYVYRRWKS